MEEKKSSEKFVNLVLAGIIVPFVLAIVIVALPFYLLGLLFNWIFNLELL